MRLDRYPTTRRHVCGRRRKRRRWPLLLLLALITPVVLYLAVRRVLTDLPNGLLLRWAIDPLARAELATSLDAPCPGYPFLVPSSGLVGGLPWHATAFPYDAANPHPGTDIFGDGSPGTIPVYAAYDGLLSREPYWVSAVTIQHDDPLHPGAIIWTYYTHMANLDGSESYVMAKFPPGIRAEPVQQGELLGYQGVYNGGVDERRIDMHLHFSIVRSTASGAYLNETVFANTIDPTPYLGLPLDDPGGAQFPLRCLPPGATG
ncbi:MAG: hypothetical protein JW910_15415 [Anaerolineae bacterium]|nr:hypothetical protein [Anaerolineae bacterium]